MEEDGNHFLSSESSAPDVSLSLEMLFNLTKYDLRMCFCMFFIVMGISGPKTLIGMAMRDQVPNEATGIAVGVLGLFGQLGLSLAGSGLAIMIERYGWKVYPGALAIAALSLSCLFLTCILLRNDTARKLKRR